MRRRKVPLHFAWLNTSVFVVLLIFRRSLSNYLEIFLMSLET